MGIGNNAQFVAKLEARRKKIEESEISDFRREEILRLHELSGNAYKLAGEEKQRKIRARAYCSSLKRWF